MSDDTLSASAYAVSPRNRVKRTPDRGHYDRETVHAILDAGMLCHVAWVLDGQPFCTPTLHWREGDTLYWHGSSASRMLRTLRGGLAACVTVSHLDGLVLARCGFNHSANYRSAICFGTARIVEDPEEKARALIAVIDRFYPERAATLRANTVQEVKATTVIAMPIDQASAKIRAKGVADDPEDLGHPVWAGVLPVRTVLGAAEPCPHMAPGIARPATLDAYAEGGTLDAALRATQALYDPA
ncbi:pyridoxamine 5'-phosphate oxidase family protein [Paroceanicella profunda]|uniref:Pyridoxamine 5'-phosphate oxidase family protein n=1 Tax=Paroceanicella profunda TaxID=2579971 RepID=A0A5B8FH63_9RHOB|nr:pyridoxamine 5'-phosphate oxidase family protein [Paroceanicella profunda]QDL92051.1 pyridoxamine 5'-phosphate oxidase family protein [Paroceanicella profunda]